MEKLRVLVADDERPSRNYILSLLSSFPSVECVGEAENGPEALDLIKNIKPDLVFLDLQMPGLSGLEVVRSIRADQMPLVAFVTAFDEYAVQAFELNAVDYLLKPVDADRLQKTLIRAIERSEKEDWRFAENERIRAASKDIDDAYAGRKLERIPVRHNESFYFVPVSDVVTFSADGELIFISTLRGEKYNINFRLKDIESRLDEDKFVRLSRSMIVNIDLIKKISSMPGGTYAVTLKTGQEIQASRLQSRLLRQKLLKI